MKAEPTISVRDAAKATGIPITTLYSRCQAGSLGKKLNSRLLKDGVWRISQKEIAALNAEKH
jgi:hypothetical protein